MQASFARAGVPLVLPPLDRPAGASRFKRILALGFAVPHLFFSMLRRRPAIIHFMLPEAYLVGAPVAALARIRVRLMSRRSLNNYQTNGAIRASERILHRTMSAVLGNSRSVVAQLKEEGVPGRRLGLIYNGIKLRSLAEPAVRMAMREKLGIAPDAPVMSMVANLIAYKGHRDLLEALGQAAGDLPAGWRLLLAGRDDGIGDELGAQARRLGIAEHVVFLGARDDIADLLSASDIGLLCSHEEGFANSILEGMAARLPMVVTDVGGNPEAAVDGVTGFVVPPRDPPALAQAITKLAKDPALRERLGAAGLQRVSERFAMDRCIDAYDRLYRKLLEGGAPADIAEIRVE